MRKLLKARVASVILRSLRFLQLHPHRKPPSIRSLPSELVLHIITFLHNDRPALTRLSSTCRPLALLIRPTIFKRVVFGEKNKIERLCALLSEAAELSSRTELERARTGVGVRGEWIKEVQLGVPKGAYQPLVMWISDTFREFMHEYTKESVETVVIWWLRERRRIMLKPGSSSSQSSSLPSTTVGQQAEHPEDADTDSKQVDAVFPSIRTLIFKKCDLSLVAAWDMLACVPNLATLSFHHTPFFTSKRDEEALKVLREQEQCAAGEVRREVRVNWPKYVERRKNLKMVSADSPLRTEDGADERTETGLRTLSIIFDMLDDRLFLFGLPSSSSSFFSSNFSSLRSLHILEVLDPEFHRAGRPYNQIHNFTGREIFKVALGPSLRVLRLTFGLVGGEIDVIGKSAAESALNAWDSGRLTGLQEVYLGPLNAAIPSESSGDDEASFLALPRPRNIPNPHVMPLLAKVLLSGSNATGTGATSPPIEVLGLCTCFDIEDIRNGIISQPLADIFSAFLQSQTHHPPHARFSEPLPLPSLRKLRLFNIFTDCTEPKLEDEDTLREWVRDAFPALVGVDTARGVAVEVEMCSRLDWKMRLLSSRSTVF